MIRINTIFFLLLLAIASCKTQQPVVTNAPVKTKTDTIKQTAVTADSITKPDEKIFKISLLLPLSLNQQFEVDSLGTESIILTSSINALNFYEGFLLAIDTLKARGNLIDYDVYDTDRDSLAIWKLLNSEAVSKSDVVMAMLPNSWNTLAAKISSIRNYPLLLLQGNSSGCLTNNEQTFLTQPVNNSQCRYMVGYLSATYPSANTIIIYRDNNKKETDLADLFYSLHDSVFKANQIAKVNYGKGEFNEIKSKLVKTKQNILVIPSSDESYVSSILNKLAALSDYRIIIAGLPTWEFFESIDPQQLEKLNTTIFNSNYIQYKSDVVKIFRKRFLETYHADPLYAAFQAYDLVQWVQAKRKKNSFHIEDKYVPITTLTNGINPVKICSTCGYENESISILKYKDGLLEKVHH